MKQSKFIILIGLLMFSGKLFSQSIKQNDLIGIWKWGSGKNYTIITIKSDTIYSQNSIYKQNQWSYKLDSINNEYFLKTLPINSESIPETIYKLGKTNQGNFTLQLYKIKMFNKNTKTWREIEPHNKSITKLVKENDN